MVYIDDIKDAQIKINTPVGLLVATLATDPDYPGIYIELEKDGVAENVALIECNTKDQTFNAHIWATNQEDYTHKIKICK